MRQEDEIKYTMLLRTNARSSQKKLARKVYIRKECRPTPFIGLVYTGGISDAWILKSYPDGYVELDIDFQYHCSSELRRNIHSVLNELCVRCGTIVDNIELYKLKPLSERARQYENADSLFT